MTSLLVVPSYVKLFKSTVKLESAVEVELTVMSTPLSKKSEIVIVF